MASTGFNPADFFSVARMLTAQNIDESKVRTAIGRVYYSLFLMSLYHFYSNGIIPKPRINKQPKHRRGMHTVIIDDVKSVSTALGGQLDALRELRIQSDYRLRPDPGYENWQQNWETARNLAESIRKLYQKHGIRI